MDKPQDIFAYITAEQNAYLLPISVAEGYDWSMKDHISRTTLYKNSQYSTGKLGDKPFKNITRPILNLQYRAEGFDVKDIELFINDAKQYYQSFLVKKYHEKWARENNIDTFIDELVENYVDFGGTLVKKTKSARPEVVAWQSIVFCDQTDILSGPIGIKHFFSPDQLLAMESAGWGKKENGATATLEEIITLAQSSKKFDSTKQREVKTPGKYIEVFEVHGNLPVSFLKEDDKSGRYSNQIHIVAYYQKEDNMMEGVTLFKKAEKKSPFKLLLRDKIYGRALGIGGAEELFEPQLWVNYSEIRMKDMLDAAAKIIYKTTDKQFAARNKTRNLENGEILVLDDNTDFNQIDNFPRNYQLFENSTRAWEEQAQTMAAASDPIMGEKPSAGTPFKLQELVTAEAHGIHEYRKGKIATFVDEIYRDWVIPDIAAEITKGDKFISELSLDELEAVADQIVECRANYYIKEQILNGELVDEEGLEKEKQRVRDEFMKGGNKRFIEILKDEMADAPFDVYTNIAGKQKDLSLMTDKLVNIFRQLVAAPQILDDPRMAKIFNEILESSGLSPINFYKKPQVSPLQPQMMPGAPGATPAQTEPLTALAK